MAVTFLAVFIIPEEPMPVDVVRYFLHLTINDSVSLRKVCKLVTRVERDRSCTLLNHLYNRNLSFFSDRD